ncbi:MAG: nitroreductase family protein [Chloroflexi bacterium]|nr:nitroreductase family protein [Chloroflexota bacterium]
MDVYEAIASRKTIRDFAPQEIDLELVKRLICAGFNAPTNNHMREWHFVLLQDKVRRGELLDRAIKPVGRKGAMAIINRWGLTDDAQREMYRDAIPKQYSMLYNAGCLILPCFRQPTPLLKPKDLSALNPFASIWCCIENILVAAASEGIFGVTRIPFEAERNTFKEFLNIPEDYEIPCYLALGYPAEGAQRRRQVNISIEERIHFEVWS